MSDSAITVVLHGEPEGGQVYKITNLVTEASYIGITRVSARKRYRNHWSESKRLDLVLYRAMRKYGPSSFKMEILATTDSNKALFEMERKFIIDLGTHVRNGGYNMTGGGEGTSDICDITRERMRAAAAARLTSEARLKISQTLKGRKRSPEAVAIGAAKRIGRPLSEAHKKKLSERAKGRVISVEQRNKIRETLLRRGLSTTPEAAIRYNTGRKLSNERKQKLRDAWVRRKLQCAVLPSSQ